MLRPLPPSPTPQADGDGTFERHSDDRFGIVEPVFFLFDVMRLAWEDRPFPLSPDYPTETPPLPPRLTMGKWGRFRHQLPKENDRCVRD